MALLTPTGTSGEFMLATGQKIRLSEWDEQDLYDTWALPAGETLSAIGTVRYFTDVQGKEKIDTNLTTNGKVPAEHEMIVLKVGIFVLPKWGQDVAPLSDQLALYQEGTWEMLKNRKVQLPEQHLWGRATGYGFVAYGVDLAAPAVVVAPGSLGVASPAAIPPLLVPFTLAHNNDFEGILRFTQSRANKSAFGAAPSTATWSSHQLAADCAVMAVLHGFMKAPGTR